MCGGGGAGRFSATTVVAVSEKEANKANGTYFEVQAFRNVRWFFTVCIENPTRPRVEGSGIRLETPGNQKKVAFPSCLPKALF